MTTNTKNATCSKLLLVFLFIAQYVNLFSQNTGTQTIDFRNYDVNRLNNATDWIQTVFQLPGSRMQGGEDGVTLSIDVNDPGPYNYTYRSELREQNINTYPPFNTSQVYHIRFTVNELPDIYGPITIFQRFNRNNDGPDIEVELTGINQFSNAVANDLQVVGFGRRERLGKFLKPINDLMIIIYTASNGKYKVSLNGETLTQREGVNTLPATAGTWTQFGIYPHGLHGDRNRQDQRNSGNTQVSFTYQSYSKTMYEYEVNLDDFNTLDLNGGGGPPDPGPEPTPPDTCSGNQPQDWDLGDIGNPTLPGEVCEDSSIYEMRAAGDDIWNTADQFYYMYRPIAGNVEMQARVLEVGNSHFWAKAGIMIRESLDGNARNVFMGLTHQGRWTFQRRTIPGDSTRSTRSEANTIAFPYYVKLLRRASWFYGYYSVDGNNWLVADSIEIAMNTQVYIGLASTSHDASSLNISKLDKLVLNSLDSGGGNGNTCTAPTGLSGQDLGSVSIAGEACVVDSSIRISASGADIWNNEDQGFYVYQPLLGDWEVSARILDMNASHIWAKTGLMIRENLDPAAKNAFMISTGGNKWSFQHRPENGAQTQSTVSPSNIFTYPHWIKLKRAGNEFTGYYSLDGTNWQIVASIQMEMTEEILLGVASTSHDTAQTIQTSIDQLNFVDNSGPPGTFPVEFTDFYGIPKPGSNEIDLVWEVAFEQGNDFFTVERSEDGNLFENIGMIPSVGDVNEQRTYTFSDNAPLTTQNIYRIKQTDIDGQFTHSQTIEISFTAKPLSSLLAYPNPLRIGQALHVDLDWQIDTTPLLELKDVIGRTYFSKMYSIDELSNLFTIDTSQLVSGIYYLIVSDQSGTEKPISQTLILHP